MSASSGPDIITNGLVLSLDASDKKSYPGSGATWFDRSGNGNHGTLIGEPTYSSANGGAIVLDGSNDYVDFGVNFRYQNNFTVECVVNLTATSPSLGVCGSVNPVITNKDYGWNMFLTTDGKPLWQVYNTTGANKSITSVIGNLSQSIHCVGYKNGTQIGLYVNGILQGTDILTSDAVYYYSNYTCSIGGNHRCGSGTFYLNGLVPMAKIYNRTLTPEEIKQNFNATKSRFGLL